MFRTKRFLIIPLGVFLVAVLVLFREQISSVLRPGNADQPGFSIDTPRSESSATGIGTTPPTSEPLASPVARFSYQGRDLSEVRPDEKAVAIFGEEGRQKLYADIRAYGEELKKEPHELSSWLQLGLLKKNIGDYEGARDAWEYAAILNPIHHVAPRNLGELYWRYLLDFPKAEARFRAAIQIQPKEAPAYVSLAELYQFSYKEKQHLAEGVLLKGVKENPFDTTLFRALADLYERRGEYGKAVEWLEKMAEQMPGNVGLQERIQELK